MDLQVRGKLFVIGGATSGFGKAVTEALVKEGAKVIAIARGDEKIKGLQKKYSHQIEGLAADITQPETIDKILKQIGARKLDGVLVNAGGPPAKAFIETNIDDWDESYVKVMRWKVSLTQALLPKLIEQNYGRLVYVESMSVKQPIPNLVLSNSFRLGVVGFVKTLAQEIADQGITLNVLAPGYHDTPAIERVITKMSDAGNMSYEDAKESIEKLVSVGRMGTAEEFASLAVWLLSPLSAYITGQTISVDGGSVQGTMG